MMGTINKVEKYGMIEGNPDKMVHFDGDIGKKIDAYERNTMDRD